jgi:hypothetical protein
MTNCREAAISGIENIKESLPSSDGIYRYFDGPFVNKALFHKKTSSDAEKKTIARHPNLDVLRDRKPTAG